MRCIKNYSTISLHINQKTYPLNKSIILNSGLNINIINQRSLLRRYKNATPGEYIWAKNNKAPIKGYGNVFIKIIISGKKNKFGDPITEIIRIPSTTFYFSFIYNIISFQKL